MFDGIEAQEAAKAGGVVACSIVVEPWGVHLSSSVAVGVVGDFGAGVLHDLPKVPVVGDALGDLSLFVGQGDDGALVVSVVVVGLVCLVVGDGQGGICFVGMVEDGGEEFLLFVQDRYDVLIIVEVAVGGGGFLGGVGFACAASEGVVGVGELLYEGFVFGAGVADQLA